MALIITKTRSRHMITVAVSDDGCSHPDLATVPPHTERDTPVAAIWRGENFHGPLAEEFYVVPNHYFEPTHWVLWYGDLGSQNDFDRAFLFACAWCEIVHGEDHDVMDPEEAAGILLYAWITKTTQWWRHYSEDDVIYGKTILPRKRVRAILKKAVRRAYMRRA